MCARASVSVSKPAVPTGLEQSYFSWAYKKNGEHIIQEAPMGLVLEMNSKNRKNLNMVKRKET